LGEITGALQIRSAILVDLYRNLKAAGRRDDREDKPLLAAVPVLLDARQRNWLPFTLAGGLMTTRVEVVTPE